MVRGDAVPRIRDIARQLDVALPGGADPTARIVQTCVRKVEQWVSELGPADTFDELLEIVAAKLKVHFEVIRSDDDLDSIVERYLCAGETGFANLRGECDAHTDAAVVRLRRSQSWSDRQYVAVIDARGAKVHKVWFSKWHELAHLIAEPQLKLAFRKTLAIRRDPVERLMDQLASELAFYSPLLLPMLRQHRVDLAKPNLQLLADFHETAFEFASLHATLIGLLRHSSVPCVLIEAKTVLKASEQREAVQGSLFPSTPPVPRLRAASTTHNSEAIRKKLYIHRWMRIPDRSVIRRVYDGDVTSQYQPTRENLSWWESQGQSLPSRAVVVEATQAGVGRVLALLKPT